MDTTATYPAKVSLRDGQNTHVLAIDGFPESSSEEVSCYLRRARKAWDSDATLVGIHAEFRYRIYLVAAMSDDDNAERYHFFISFLAIESVVVRILVSTGEKRLDARTQVEDWRVDTLAECEGFRTNLAKRQMSRADCYRHEQLLLLYARYEHDADPNFRLSSLGNGSDSQTELTLVPKTFRQTLELFISTGNFHKRLSAEVIENDVEWRVRYYYCWLDAEGFLPKEREVHVHVIATAIGRAWQSPESLPFRLPPILPKEQVESNPLENLPGEITQADIVGAQHEYMVGAPLSRNFADRTLRIVDTPQFRSLLLKQAPKGTSQQDLEKVVEEFMGPFHRYFASKHPGYQEYLDNQAAIRDLVNGLISLPLARPAA